MQGSTVDHGEHYRVGDLLVDVAGATVSRGDERIVLPPRTFELLVALVRHHPGTVRRRELLETVWHGEHVTDQALSHRVMVLRKALGDHAEEPRYVAGERGFGYRLVSPVEALASGDPRPRGPAGAPLSPRWRPRGLAVGGVFAVLAFLGIVFGLVRRSPGPVPPTALTVAVRPFEGAPGAPRLDPLVGDLERVIERALGRVPGVRVLPRSASTEGTHLRVEGTLHAAAGGAELRLRLVDGTSRRAEWSRAFRGSLYALLAQGDEMGRTVAEEVRQRAAPGSAPLPPGVPPRVRRLLWRGELYWFTFTEDGLRRSAEGWNAAAALVPDRAAVHAGRSLTAAIRGYLGHVPPDEAEAEARAGASRAVGLEPDLPAARLAASLVSLLFDWNTAEAAAAARAAAGDDHHDPRGPVVLALTLQARGRLDESLDLLKGAAEADPHGAAAPFLAGRALEMKGHWSAAAAAYARALAREPGLAAARRGSAECLTLAGREREAVTALGEVPRDGASPTDALRAAWRWRCRADGAARDTVHACLLGGETARAVRALAAALQERRPFVLFVPEETMMRSLADRPVLRAIRERVSSPAPVATPG